MEISKKRKRWRMGVTFFKKKKGESIRVIGKLRSLLRQTQLDVSKN